MVKKETNKKEVLNEADVLKLKQKWGAVFKVNIDGEIYIFRKLKRKEYSDILSTDNNEESDIANFLSRQEEISKAVTLYPKNIKEKIDSNAGIATIISEQCMERSGFNIIGKIEEL